MAVQPVVRARWAEREHHRLPGLSAVASDFIVEGVGMPGPIHVRDGLWIPEAEVSWRFSRSSGPGGQGVNTTDSRVELVFDLANSRAIGPRLKARAIERLANRLADGVLVISASEHRSQLRNREAAEKRLGEIIAESIAPPPRPRRPTRATRASVERRIAGKKRRGQVKRLRRGADD